MLTVTSAWAGEPPARWHVSGRHLLPSAEASWVERAFDGSVPPRLADLSIEVVFRESSGVDAASDTAQSAHSTVRSRGHTLVVDLSSLRSWAGVALAAGSDPAEVDAVAVEILRRHLMHAAAHVLDAARRHSAAVEWRSLSEWNVLGGSPAERQPLSYADAYGMVDVAEDFAGAVALYASQRSLPWDAMFPAPCRMRSKWRYVSEVLGSASPRQFACDALAGTYLSPLAIEAIDVVYILPSARNPASIAGHMAIAVVRKGEGAETLRTDVFQLAADLGARSVSRPELIVRGLAGGFDASVIREPLHRLAARYAIIGRSLRRYRLQLNSVEQLRLLERLEDLRDGMKRPYEFLTRNCAYLPRHLVEHATRSSLGLPRLHGPDAVIGALLRNHRVSELPPRELHEVPPAAVDDAAQVMRTSVAEELVASNTQHEGVLRRLLRLSEHPNLRRRARALRSVSDLAPELQHPRSAERLAEYVYLSEVIERARLRTESELERKPIFDALWELHSAASEHAGPSIHADHRSMEAELFDAARAGLSVPVESSHTSLRRLDVRGGAALRERSFEPVVEYETALLAYRMGEIRHAGVAEGLSLTLLGTTMTATTSTFPRISGSATLLRIHKVAGSKVAGNVGGFLRVGEAQWDLFGAEQNRFGIAEIGPSLELLQFERHRFHLSVSSGVAVAGYTGADGFSGPVSIGLQFPVRGVLAITAKEHPLTSLDAEVTHWIVASENPGRASTTGDLVARLYVAAVHGSDLALSARGAITGTSFGSERADIDARLTFGITMERF